MKKIFTLVAVLFIGLSAIFADEYVVSKIDCMAADGFYDRELMALFGDLQEVS